MDTNNTSNNRIHPLVAAAAVSVMLVSLIGVAAITGVLPASHSKIAPPISMETPAAVVADAPEAPEPAPAKLAAKNTDRETIKQAAPRAVKQASSEPRPAPRYSEQKVAQAPRICENCGRVESVQAVQQPGNPSGVGVAAGAVIGGLLGNQVGGGNGKTLATIAGAVGGGYAGNEVEKRTRTHTTYQVRVRMEDGRMRSFPMSNQPGWSVGDRVRVVNGALTSRA